MNNIFNTYDNNLFHEYIKNNINLKTNLNNDTLKLIIYEINKHKIQYSYNIKKLIITIINTKFNYITLNDIRPLFLLSIKHLNYNMLNLSLHQLINYINKYCSNNQVIVSEIMTNLTYNNRSLFAFKFRTHILKLLCNKENFNNSINISNETDFLNNDNNYIYLKDKNTLHNFSEISNINIPNDLNIKNKNLNDEQMVHYARNTYILYTLIKFIDNQLIYGNIKNRTIGELIYIKDILQKIADYKLLLLAEYIDFKSLFKYFENHDVEKVNNLNVDELINEVNFNKMMKNINNIDISNINEELLIKYSRELIRNLNKEELETIIDIEMLFGILFEKYNNHYLKFINNIKNKKNINFINYSSLNKKNKKILVESISDYDIKKLIIIISNNELSSIININKMQIIISDKLSTEPSNSIKHLNINFNEILSNHSKLFNNLDYTAFIHDNNIINDLPNINLDKFNDNVNSLINYLL